MFTTWGTISVIFFTSISIFLLIFLKRIYANRQFDIKPLLVIFVMISLRLALPLEIEILSHFSSTRILVFLNDLLTTEIIYGYTLFNLLIFLWVFISSIKLINLIRKTYLTYRLFSIFPSIQLSNDILLSLNDFIPKRRKINVICVDFISAPMVIGFIKCTIILPKRTYSKEELSLILQHELTHFRNHHIWIKLLIEIIYALYWWNPLLLMMRKQTYELLEKDVDISVLKANKTNVATYAKFLLKMYKEACEHETQSNVTWKKSPLISEFARNKSQSEFIKRCQLILTYNNVCIHQTLNKAFYIILLAIVVSVSFVTIQPSYPLPTEDDYFILTNDNTYLIKSKQGFDVYYENKYLETITNITSEYEHLTIRSK